MLDDSLLSTHSNSSRSFFALFTSAPHPRGKGKAEYLFTASATVTTYLHRRVPGRHKTAKRCLFVNHHHHPTMQLASSRKSLCKDLTSLFGPVKASDPPSNWATSLIATQELCVNSKACTFFAPTCQVHLTQQKEFIVTSPLQ